MENSRDKIIRAVGATVLLLGIAIAAVAQMGPGDDPTVSLTPQDVPAPTERPSEPSVAPEPFVYRVGVLSGISTDNFWAFYGRDASVWNAYILGPTKPALYRIDPQEGTLEPELARSIVEPVSIDGAWQVRVYLDDTMTWSDGTKITTEDFVFTFDVVRRLKLKGSWAGAFPETVRSVVAETPHSLRIEFSERPTIAVWPHAVGTAPVMPAHVWQQAVTAENRQALYQLPGDGDVGGGPLALTDSDALLTRSMSNPGYGTETAPDTVEYHVYEDEEAAVTALAAGEIDTFLSPHGLSAESARTLRTGTVEIHASPANSIRYLGFNLERRPMGDPAFRVALALLLDREGLAEDLAGSGQVAHGLVSPANELLYDAEAAQAIGDLYTGDVESRLARALEGLRDAGYTWATAPSVAEDGAIQGGIGLTINGVEPAPLTILTPGDEYDSARPAYVEEIARALERLGFEARPVVTDFDTVVDLTFDDGGDPSYDMYLLGWTLGNPALPDHYRPLFSTGGTLNNTGYDSGVFNRALREYEGSYTLEDAREALWSMETILAHDLPYLLLYTSEIVEAYRSDRISFALQGGIGGIQGRLGGIGDVNAVH